MDINKQIARLEMVEMQLSKIETAEKRKDLKGLRDTLVRIKQDLR